MSVKESHTCTFSQLLALFRNTLRNVYDEPETDAVFYRLMHDCFEMEKSKVVAQFNSEMPKFLYNQIIEHLKRLEKCEPLQYITNKILFYGLDMSIVSGVFIPRPETEELVKFCLQDISTYSSALDICTGSGCIALAIAKNRPQAKITCIDISKTALEIAENNAKQLELNVNFLLHDIFVLPESFYQQRFDVIVSNPPYVRISEKQSMHKNVLNFEPHKAIFVNDDNPLVYYREIVKIAARLLEKTGTVWVEINENLGQETVRVFDTCFNKVELYNDFNGKNRFIRASERK